MASSRIEHISLLRYAACQNFFLRFVLYSVDSTYHQPPVVVDKAVPDMIPILAGWGDRRLCFLVFYFPNTVICPFHLKPAKRLS
jgi:hypothetical protein